MPNPSLSTPKPEGDESTKDRVVAELVPKVQSLHLDDEGEILHRNGSAAQPRGDQSTTGAILDRYKGVPLVTKFQSLDLVNDGQVAEDAEMLLLAKVCVGLGFMLKQKNRWRISDELAEPVRILQECEAMLTSQAEVGSEGGDQVTLLERATGLFCKANNLFITYRDGNYVSDSDKCNFSMSMYEDVGELELELVPQPKTTLKRMKLKELRKMRWYAFDATLYLEEVLNSGCDEVDEEDEEGYFLSDEPEEDEEGDFIRDEPYYF